MTFIPNVLTKNDPNNTFTSQTTTQTGVATLTTGYEAINVIINSYSDDSNPGGLAIQFSPDTTQANFTTYYSDTYYKNTKFNKSYKILNKYYRIVYTPSGSTAFTITSILTVSTDSNVVTLNNNYTNNHDSLYDAFAKLRVSNPYTSLDIKFPIQSSGNADYLSNNYLMCSKETGTGTFTITNGDSKKIISIAGNGSSNNYVSQSRKYYIYQPGKSQLVLLTGILKDGSATSINYQNYIGYFDANNGLFFQYDANGSTGVSVNVRSNTSGSIVDTSTVQSSWNIDKMDGTGTSGYTIDFTKSQLYVIDFEWLSVGRIRFGFYIFGKIYYCHQIANLNELEGPYMKSADLPIRYEINVEDSGTAQLTQICSSVISEGGYNPIGKTFSVSNGTTSISVGTTETALIAIRGSKATNVYNHENILPADLSILNEDKVSLLIRIRLYLAPNSPMVASWTLANTNSIVQYAVAGITNLTPTNILIKEEYVIDKSNFNLILTSIFNNFKQITSNVDNESDVLVITGQTSAGSGDVFASLDWQEIY